MPIFLLKSYVITFEMRYCPGPITPVPAEKSYRRWSLVSHWDWIVEEDEDNSDTHRYVTHCR